MFFVVVAIFSRKVAKNAKFLSFFCAFAALREPFDSAYFENHKLQQYQEFSKGITGTCLLGAGLLGAGLP